MDGEEGDTDFSPFSFCDSIYNWLDTALDYGLSERDFWEMTFAEINRFFKSKMRTAKLEEQRRACSDYKLADLIGVSVARVHNSANKYPSLYEAYPRLFNSPEVEEQIQNKKDELSALRFKQFANSYNNSFTEEVYDRTCKKS
jgi:hypothetical protein